MKLEEWIQAYATRRLIIRMELTSFSNTPQPGNESVRASLVGYSPDRSLLAHVHFERFGGATVGSLYIDAEDGPAKFSGFIKHSVVSLWEQSRDRSWDVESETVFQLKKYRDGTGIERLPLHASNMLVLQHLAHIQGAIGQAIEKFDDSRVPALAKMTHVLGTIIIQGNKELIRLTQMS